MAIYFEGELGDTCSYTHAQLTEEVKKAANAFESPRGQGDRVAVYLPMIPEAVITLLACPDRRSYPGVRRLLRRRPPLTHRRMPEGPSSLSRRTAPTGVASPARSRPPSMTPWLHDGHTVQNVVVVAATARTWTEVKGRDHWWADTVGTATAEHTAVGHDSEHPLYIPPGHHG